MKSWKDYITSTQGKGDRSTAILGGVYLKAHLGQLLARFCVEQAEVRAVLLKEEQPLGSFSARIKLAYALGLVSEHEYHDLILIQGIYYDFLNQLDGSRFSDDDIKERCMRLKIPQDVMLPMERQTPRDLFLYATAILAQQLSVRITQAEKEKRQPRENIAYDGMGS
jgi:DNA-binding MltR family transcriptional regulator